MSEREPRNIVSGDRWPVDRLAERFGQEPEAITDDDYGTGHLIGGPADVEANERRFIALYPETNVATISSKNVDVTIRNAIAREAKDGILVETQDNSTRVLFLRDGHVAVEVFPAPIPKPVEPPLLAVNRPDEKYPLCLFPLVLRHLTAWKWHRSNRPCRPTLASRKSGNRA